MVKNKKKAKQKTSKSAEFFVKKAFSSARTKVVQKAKEILKPVTQRIEVHVVRKTLGKAPEEHHFVLHDGRKLKSLYDLVDELETMSEDAFKEYVSDFKNDFSNWAKDVFNASDLAEELKNVKNRFDAQKSIMKHIMRDAKELAMTLSPHEHQTHTHESKHSPTECKGHVHQAGRCIIK